MSTDNLIARPPWSEDSALPPRSYLFSLPPKGKGTPHQESLISYFLRLCHAHSVNPRHMLSKVLAVTEPDLAGLFFPTFFAQSANTVNGLSLYAKLFSSVLNKLTARPDLSYLTMLPWQHLLPRIGQSLLAKRPRWCPRCLLEQHLRGEETTIPLAWSIDIVDTCTIHRQLLQDKCPTCGKHQSFMPRYPDWAICDSCKKRLVSNEGMAAHAKNPFPDDAQLWIAAALGDMIRAQSKSDFLPTVEYFRQFMLDQVTQITSGNFSVFCRTMGLNFDALNGLVNKGQKPSITQFLGFCYGLKMMPSAIFCKQKTAQKQSLKLRPLIGALLPRTKRKAIPVSRKMVIKAMMQTYVEAADCPSLKEITNNLGLPGHPLHSWFPELSKQITARHRECVKRRAQLRHEMQSKRTEELIQLFLAAGGYPSQWQLNKMLRQEGICLGQKHVLEAYKAALVKCSTGDTNL